MLLRRNTFDFMLVKGRGVSVEDVGVAKTLAGIRKESASLAVVEQIAIND
jgi:hypothetical protein